MGLIPTFRQLGLLWDDSSVTDDMFLQFIRGHDNYRRRWALTRLLERAPLATVCDILTLEEIESALSEIKLKPQMRKAWEHAVSYWRKKT